MNEMREIKFKGKTLSGEWVFGNLALLKNKLQNVPAGSYISNSAGSPFAYQVRPETVGQFTGLKDKNGKEIYEGDIVNGWIQDQKQPFIVKYRSEGFRCGFWGVKPECDDSGIEIWYDEIHVVGNIHDNP